MQVHVGYGWSGDIDIHVFSHLFVDCLIPFPHSIFRYLLFLVLFFLFFSFFFSVKSCAYSRFFILLTLVSSLRLSVSLSCLFRGKNLESSPLIRAIFQVSGVILHRNHLRTLSNAFGTSKKASCNRRSASTRTLYLSICLRMYHVSVLYVRL